MPEQRLQADREDTHVTVNATENPVHQRDQRKKRNQHDRYIEGKLSAIDGATGDSGKDIVVAVHVLL